MKVDIKTLKIKPRVFVGSSSEGLETARVIKKQISRISDCEIWDEGVFGLNESYFETLVKIPNVYDFAVLIATKDDKTKSRKKLFDTARDNVIFEFGIFLGKLGKRRVYILMEDGVKLPSDLMGITVLTFSKTKKSTVSDSLEKSIKRLSTVIKEETARFIYTALPSTALAQGYFNNFIHPVCKNLNNEKAVWLKELPVTLPGNINKDEFKHDKKIKEWVKFEMVIVVPDDLHKDYQDRIKRFIDNKHLSRLEVSGTNRGYNFYINAEQAAKETLRLYDIPTTLSSIDEAIKRLVPKTYIGEEEKLENMLKKREIANFVKTLEFLINENVITATNCTIEIIDI
jgi:predicted nucleotide-binding protein